MRSRLLLRRSATAVGIYSSVVLGFLGTVIAARTFSKDVFGLFSIVLLATSFFQSFFDLTVEEAVVKFGFRYTTREDWAGLRRLFTGALAFKVSGALIGGLGLIVLAPFSGAIFGDSRLEVPLLIASALPLAQSLEGLAASMLFLHGRYDVRSLFLVVSMALRLAAIAVGTRYGLTTAIAAIVVAQVAATAAVGIVGLAAFRRFPARPSRRLGPDRREIASFVVQSSAATGVISVRGALVPLVLGVVTSPAQVGFFKVAQSPQAGFAALSAPARMILLTEQTRDWERHRELNVIRGTMRYSRWAGALAIVVLPPVIWWMPALIGHVYGRKYLGATDAARIFALTAGLLFVYGWTKSLPVTIGRPNLRILTHGVETLVVIPLVAVLGAAYGATGAAIAMLAAAGVFILQWTWIFFRLRHEVLARPVDPPLPPPEALLVETEAVTP